MAESEDRVLRIRFVGDVGDLERQLDRVEQRASRVRIGSGGGGSSLPSGPGSVSPAPGRLDDLYETRYENRLVKDLSQQRRAIERAQERELRAAQRAAEAEERRAAQVEARVNRNWDAAQFSQFKAGERIAKRASDEEIRWMNSQADRYKRNLAANESRYSRNVELAQFAQFKQDEKEAARIQNENDAARRGTPYTGQLDTSGGGGRLEGMLFRRFVIGAGVVAGRDVLDAYARRLNVQDAAPFQTPNQQVQSLLSEAESESGGVGGLFWRAVSASRDTFNLKRFSPVEAARDLRTELQRESAQDAETAAIGRTRTGQLGNQSLAASVMGDQYTAKLLAIESERQQGLTGATEAWAALNKVHSQMAGSVFTTLTGQANTRAALAVQQANIERDASIEQMGIAGYAASLRGNQRDDAQLIDQQLRNSARENLEGDDATRTALSRQNRAEELATRQDIQRNRDLRQIGYGATTAAARFRGSNNTYAAEQVELAAAAEKAFGDAPQGEKLQAWLAADAQRQAAWSISDRVLGNQVTQARARVEQAQAEFSGNKLQASLIGIEAQRQTALQALPAAGQGGPFEAQFNLLRQQVNAQAQADTQLATKQDANSRWLVNQQLQNQVDVSKLLADRREKSAQATEIQESSQLQSQRFLREGGPDSRANARLALQTGINREQAFLSELELTQYGGARSFQDIGPGGIGAGNRNGDRTKEDINKGMDAVRQAITDLKNALLGVQ